MTVLSRSKKAAVRTGRLVVVSPAISPVVSPPGGSEPSAAWSDALTVLSIGAAVTREVNGSAQVAVHVT
jgi:hypothetical protein